MATYTDDRNWDQKELDRARELAKKNVVTEGSSVPNAARLNADRVLDAEKPHPVLDGERPTTKDEVKEVAAREDTSDVEQTAIDTFNADHSDSTDTSTTESK